MLDFNYQAFEARIVFGPGKVSELPAEIERLEARSVLVISTGSQRAVADIAIDALGSAFAARIDGAVMHVPREHVVNALETVRQHGCDCVVAIGGGSALGVAKGVALETGLPVVAVPSTYAGSEMTDIWGISEGDGKTTGRDKRVVPKTVIYDPDLTRGLPGRLAGPSGINAMAHSVEALYAQNRNPVLAMIAEEGIRAMASGLPSVCDGSAGDDARGQALYGAFMCGLALATATMGIHHKLCHVIGGTFRLPHAETHTIILPHATHYNRDAAPEAMQAIARALNADSAASGIFDLAKKIGAPTALKDLGLDEKNLDRAADIATASPYYNPQPVDREGVRALLDAAFHGHRPG
ncbi:MAG: maleylacetate reductase [Paracoccaceae bacterium]|jgi:maleylacetate reductase